MREGSRHRYDLEKSPLPAASAFAGDQAIQHISFVSPWCKNGERTATLRHDKAFSRPHSPQVATQILAQLTNTDSVTHIEKCSTFVATSLEAA